MKKENKKALALIVGIILFESITYLLAKFSPFEPTLLISKLDNKLPLVEEFVIFYVLWYLYLVLLPYLFFKLDRSKYFKYVAVTSICITISFFVFFFFPTTITRGNVNLSNNLFIFILKIIYFIDTPILNCLPSMHCALSMILFVLVTKTNNLKIGYKIIINLTLILIIISTLLIKQHVTFDVIAAVIIVFISFIINKIIKIDLKISACFSKK